MTDPGNNPLILTGTANSTTASIVQAGFSVTKTNSLQKTGSGKWTVTGNASYAGATTITAGTLEFQGSLSSSGITNSSALIFNNAATQSYSNAISGTGTLTKDGAGILTLSGSNGYTGATNVNNGTLRINGSTSASSTVGVASTGTLGGTGTIGGAVNVTGQLSPGASIETLGTGTLSFLNTSTLVHELDSSVGTSVGSDLLKVGGNLNLTGTVNLTLTDIALTDVAFAANTVFSLINYTGTWNGGLFTLSGNELADEEVFSFGLNTWKISYNDATGGSNYAGEYAGGSDSFVNLTVIPEPSAALLGGLGALLLLRRRRNRTEHFSC
jgi:autotransporter-associated beta strand protein